MGLFYFAKYTINCVVIAIFYLRLMFSPINCTVVIPNTMGLNCSPAFERLESQGVGLHSISRTLNENGFHYCEPSSRTCCTQNVETKLAAISKLQFEKYMKESITKLHSVLGTRAQKFKDLFSQLLVESKKEFHSMFKRTYGVIYEQNAYVFSEFFSELETYFARGKIDLTEVLDTFFNNLYQKLFTVLNAQYTFDDKYLGCISEHMKELEPFGDVPDKLSVQIKRSFVATRTYAQALSAAADITKNMINVKSTLECNAALTKMSECGLCKGFVEKPCATFCVTVVKGCLQYYSDLDNEWENFITSMEKISERLLGPFNIVMVIEPINVKISDAIMNFQEKGQEITKQVFQGCGRPLLGFQKRFSSQHISVSHNGSDNYREKSREEEFEQSKTSGNLITKRENKATKESSNVAEDDHTQLNEYSNVEKSKRTSKRKKQRNKLKLEDLDNNKEPILDKLIKDIKQKIKDLKNFWANLPYQICNNEYLAVLPTKNNSCWNGSSISSNSELSLAAQTTQPIVGSFGSHPRQAAIIGSQLYFLKVTVNNLHNAYNGQDVEWTDQEESYFGSGSGSGNGLDYEEESGSGLGYSKNSFSSSDHTESTSIQTYTTNISSNINITDSKDGNENVKRNRISKENRGNKFTSVSLRRALITYLLPICITWLGSIVSDLL